MHDKLKLNSLNRIGSNPNMIASLLAVIALLCAIVVPLPPMNQMVTIVFDRDVPSNASGKVSASFGQSEKAVGVKPQHLTVSGHNLSYKPDPLTYDASTLHFDLSDVGDAQVVRVDGEVNVNNHHWWTAHRITAGDLRLSRTGDSISFDLSRSQIRSMVSGWKLLNPGRLALLVLVLVGIAIVLLHRLAFAAVPLPWFASAVMVVALTAMGAWRVWALDASGRSRLTIIAILLGFLLLTGLNAIAGSGGTARTAWNKPVIILDYVVMLVAAFGQGLVYILKWSHSPDEIAHLSYLAWEKAHLQLVPDFAGMRVYETVFSGRADLADPLAFNQLGHPPLYYILMLLVPGTHVSGTVVTFHVAWLRMASLLMLLAGLAVCAYLLYSRLPRIPLLHLVAALALVASPNMVQVSSGVNNDALCLLTVTLTVWGVVRFRERRYDWRTYLLIMGGLSTTLLTKLTAGMIAALLCLFVVIAAMGEREARFALTKREFWFTTPLLIPAIAYYAVVFVRYRSIQPSYQKLDPAGYMSSTFYKAMSDRSDMSIMQYVDYYITQFLRTWWSMPWQADIPRSGVTSFDARTIALTLLLAVPFAVLAIGRNSRGRTGNLLAMGMGAIALTMLYQFNNALNGFYVNGYTGGLQSRYYLCAMVIIVYALCWLLWRWFGVESESDAAALSGIGTLVCAGFTMMLVWDGLLQPFLLQQSGLAAIA
ncbi:hypothetical protein CPA40_11145 [Bifidobacterium callitrichos]|uniref:Uncharacterized protein n=2 Tax=Bifidobacterium callitrichos TaxID=762209 RepID=A0A2T3G7H6_9BIFI|nr:hypothetical protein CPA40_11145 [Bifidobacterium callitrichos]